MVGRQVTQAMKIAGSDKQGEYHGEDKKDYKKGLAQSPSDSKKRILEHMAEVHEYEWYPTCECNAPVRPSIVLDPFAGSGTTLKVASRKNRLSIGYELSIEYCELIKKRLQQGEMAISTKVDEVPEPEPDGVPLWMKM